MVIVSSDLKLQIPKVMLSLPISGKEIGKTLWFESVVLSVVIMTIHTLLLIPITSIFVPYVISYMKLMPFTIIMNFALLGIFMPGGLTISSKV